MGKIQFDCDRKYEAAERERRELRRHRAQVGKRFDRISILVQPDVHFRSMVLPPNYKYAREAGIPMDKTGQPLISSRAQIDRMVSLANQHGENLMYNDGLDDPVEELD